MLETHQGQATDSTHMQVRFRVFIVPRYSYTVQPLHGSFRAAETGFFRMCQSRSSAASRIRGSQGAGRAAGTSNQMMSLPPTARARFRIATSSLTGDTHTGLLLLSDDELDQLATHLPPSALGRLLGCCRKLWCWGRARAFPAQLELELRHMARLTDDEFRRAVRRYPCVQRLQLDCWGLSSDVLRGATMMSAAAPAAEGADVNTMGCCWGQHLRELRLTHCELHTDALLAPLAAAGGVEGSGSGPGGLGARLTTLTLSIGANPETCHITAAGVARALSGCPCLARLGLDLGRSLQPCAQAIAPLLPWRHRRGGGGGSWAPCCCDRLEELSLAGHWLGEAVCMLFDAAADHGAPTTQAGGPDLLARSVPAGSSASSLA
jgi:hypothetical protein